MHSRRKRASRCSRYVGQILVLKCGLNDVDRDRQTQRDLINDKARLQHLVAVQVTRLLSIGPSLDRKGLSDQDRSRTLRNETFAVSPATSRVTLHGWT